MANVCQPKQLSFYWELANGNVLVADADTQFQELSADEFAERFASIVREPEAPTFAPREAKKHDITPNAVSPLGGVTIVDPSKL